MYIRVSTVSQVETDYDPEGISIPSQRKACQQRAEQMGVRIIDEYVEAGKSATTITKRPVFQAMLERCKTLRDVDYVIVYNLSRLNRNRVDDANTLVAMRAIKVTLISAQENIDETPAGQLMHGLLAAFNEYRSNADGADIRYKMGQKAKNGGTIGAAPLGYRNVRDQYEGREVRTVAVDQERGPYVTQAFELYASGDYSFERLRQVLTDRGLRTPGRGRSPVGPISTSKIGQMLRDRYYTGVVIYQDEPFPGRHPALISQSLFDRVQSVLDSHASAGVRHRTHHHELKGLLWCAYCHAEGRESRMILQRTVGRHGGVYNYFFCRARQEKLCSTPHLPVAQVEESVRRQLATLVMPTDFANRVRQLLQTALDSDQSHEKHMRRQLKERLSTLETQENNLLDLAAGGTLAASKIRARLQTIADERERIEKDSDKGAGDLLVGTEVIRAALDLIEHVGEAYRQGSQPVRRDLVQAFFSRLYVDGDGINEERLTSPYDEILYLRRRPSGPASRPPRRARGSRRAVARATDTPAGLLEAAFAGGGSSETAMVELRGFEPLTPSMPWRCATSCATAPWAMRNRAAGTPDYSRPSPATAPPTASSRAASRASTSRSTHGIAGQSFHSRSRA